MKKALVHNNRICEVRENTFPVAAELIWVDVPDNTTVYDTYVGGAVVKHVSETQDYKDKRRAEYPSFLDYLDGVVKNNPKQIQDYIDRCLAVKTKYPKD